MEISEIDHGLALLPTVSDLSQRVFDLQDSVRYTETSVSLQLNQMLVDQHGVNSALGSLTSAVEVASNRTQLLEVDLSSLEQGVSSTRQDLLNRVQHLTDQVHQVGLTVETTRSVTDSQISYIQKSLTETVPRETHETAIQTLTETILELRQSLQDQASVSQQLRSGLLCNEDRFQTELYQLQQEVQSLRLLQSDFQTRVPAEFSETRHLVEELDKSNKHLSACVSDLTRENSQLTKQVLFLKEQLNRHQQELQELRTQTPETQQATEPTSVPTSSDSNEVPALVRDLNERIASLAAGLTSNMNDLKESIIVMDQDKKLGQATKFTIVPSSDHQDDCAFFIRQLLETADRCQLSDNDRRSLLGLAPVPTPVFSDELVSTLLTEGLSYPGEDYDKEIEDRLHPIAKTDIRRQLDRIKARRKNPTHEEILKSLDLGPEHSHLLMAPATIEDEDLWLK
ncbi:unnamed protein product, partial [Aphanomyces euteiches]